MWNGNAWWWWFERWHAFNWENTCTDEPFLGKGHVLFTGNNYTIPTSLAKHSTDNSTHFCGTIKTNRYNYSKDIINEALEKDDAVFYPSTDDPMIACKYWSAKDKASGQQKVVYMFLTCHQPIMVDIANPMYTKYL